MFDAEDLLQNASEPMSTEYPNVPEGEWEGQITKLEPRQFSGKKDPSKTYTTLDVTWSVSDPIVLQEMKRDTAATVRQSLFLDMTSEGKIDETEGTNVRLGRLRAALNQNESGWKPADLMGGIATVRVKHDGEGYANVSDVTGA